MINHKGTLHVQQHKNNDPLQFIVFYGLRVFTRFLVEKAKETEEEWTTVYGLLYCKG